jgi:tripartite-type tricarboxylate transporter receptor subunit TctC
MKTTGGLLMLSALLMVAGSAAAQSNYPEKAVRFVAPFPPGTAGDISGRIVSQKFTEAWGKPVVVENIPGAAGSVGAERVAKAAPDGYTLLFSGDAAMTTNVSLYPKLAYDPVRDFAPIMNFIETPNILVLHPSVPAKSVKELVALAKARPGQINYASAGSGTSQHLAGELLKSMASIDIVHIPYKGGPQALTDVLSGRVVMFFGNVFFTLPQVRAGKLRPLAVSSLKRASAIPELPTMAESGFSGFEAVAWFGLLAPAATPAPILAKLQQESARVIALADVRSKFVESGAEIIGNSPAEFAAQIKAEIVKKGKLIKASGAKPD